MARYSKQTWDTTSIFNPTRMNHIEQGIYDADLTEGGTIKGNLLVQRDNSYGLISLGKGSNSSENGILQLYDKVSHYANIRTVDNLGANRDFYLPNKAGTIALTSDDDWISISQNVTSVDISNTSYKEYLVIVLITSVSPNVCFNLILYKNINLLTGKLKYKLGDWANQSFGSSVEITAQSTGNIEVVSSYLNGTNSLANTKMFVSGRH